MLDVTATSTQRHRHRSRQLLTLAFRAAVAAMLLAAATFFSTTVARRSHVAAFAKHTSHGDVSSAMRATFTSELDSIDRHLALLGTSGDVASRRVQFRIARHHYKLIEGLVADYSPPLVAALNSSETERPDDDQAAGFRVPRGFQRIEPWIFPMMDDAAWHGASREIESMHTAIAHVRPTIPYITTTDDNALEIVRLELARVSTLGIAGFDVDESGDAIVESADVIDGLRVLTNRKDRDHHHV
jgi:cytochrome c peroxidase